MLAETDVINMVSRGISAPNILKGIHLSMAGRLSKLLKSIGATQGVVMVTGGLALDDGLVAALEEDIAKMKDMKATIRSHPDSIYAGAIGAALWGAYPVREARRARHAAARRPETRRTTMALMITEACTACDACEPVCPNKAITAGNPIYVIDPLKCTECVGAEDEPQCKLVCPANCIVPNPDWVESQDDLLAKYQAIAWMTAAMSFTNRVSQTAA